MTHAITNTNGRNEMAYVGEKPWHGLGQELQPGATIETWKEAAGMSWKVQRSKVRYATGRGAAIAEWDDHHVLLRSDTKAPLGLVSEHFKVVQPGEVLEFFRDLTEAAGFQLETAGTLHGGRKFWALVSIGASAQIVGKDFVKGKLMLATACDGTMRSIAKNVAERVVCANTLAIAMSETGAPQVEVSHRSVFDAAAVKKELSVAVTSFERFIADARRLAARKIDGAEANLLVATLVNPRLAELQGASFINKAIEEATEDRAFRKILALFQGDGRGADAPGAKGTAWGLVNAVTEYADHHAVARSQDNRLDSAWFGRGDALKRKAMEAALELTA